MITFPLRSVNDEDEIGPQASNIAERARRIPARLKRESTQWSPRASRIGRFILDVDRVPDPGSEAKVAVSCFERLAPHVPGAQAIIYDTALRGVHHQTILRELGFVPVNMVAAAETFGSKTLNRKIKRREKTVHVEDKEVDQPDGSTITVRLFSEAGAIGLMRPTEAGELQFSPSSASGPIA